jgi:hypothetical protein
METIVNSDYQKIVQMIALALRIPIGSAETILKYNLNMGKLLSQRVPKMHAIQFVLKFNTDFQVFLNRTVMGSEIKQQSKQCDL